MNLGVTMIAGVGGGGHGGPIASPLSVPAGVVAAPAVATPVEESMVKTCELLATAPIPKTAPDASKSRLWTTLPTPKPVPMSVVVPVAVFTDVSVTGLVDWAWLVLQLWPWEGAVALVDPEVVVLVVPALNDEGSLLVRMLRTDPPQLAASPK